MNKLNFSITKIKTNRKLVYVQVTERLRHPHTLPADVWGNLKTIGWKKLAFGAKRLKAALVLAVVLVFAISPLFHPKVFATTLGPNAPTAAASVAGTGTTWTSPTNVFSSNAAYATVAPASGSSSYYLEATGYSFNLPAGATIDGVTVGVQRLAASSTKQAIRDNTVALLVGGSTTPSSSNYAVTGTNWPTTSTNASYGGSTDTWGMSLTAAQVNASNFGVAVSVNNVHLSGGSSTLTASVDFIQVTIDYHVVSLFNQASYRVFGNQDATGQAFAPKTTYPVGGGAHYVATADFNGDGKQDFAVVASVSNTVSVLINNGDGTFAPKVDYPTGSGPESVAAADFNGDGKPDLAVANKAGNTVSIFINNGNGTFAASVDYATSLGPQSVAAADFNGDGKPDLAVAMYSANTVSIFINNGNGTFAASVDYPTGNSPYSVTVADFNGDGKPDLATASDSASTVSILMNNGSGTFAANVDYPMANSAESVAAADFNGDGKPDLAAANYGALTVSIFINNGNGTFAAHVDYPTGSGPFSVAAADFNGDGKPDLAIPDYYVNTVSVLINNGDGTFAPKVDYPTGSGPESVATADFNGDGRTDLATPDYGDSTAAVLMNGSGAVDVGSPLAALNTAATVPGDGQPFRVRVDIGITQASLVASGQAFKLEYAPLSGGSCSATSGYADVSSTTNVQYYQNTLASNGAGVVANANDPTDPANTSGYVYETYQGKGTTSFSNATAINVGQDGIWDFALTTYHTVQNTHYCLKMTSSTGTPLNTYTNYPELITPAATLNQASYRWYTGNNSTGLPAFSLGASNTTGPNAYAIKTADFNGDGKADLAVINNGSNTVSIFMGNGDGTFAANVDYATGVNPHALTAADFNGDGKPDLAVPNYSDNTVSVLINNGDGTFAAKVDYATGSSPWGVAAADFNGDGKIDIATGNEGAGTVSVLMNNGSGSFTTKVDYAAAGVSQGLTAADFNGDGKPDLAITNSTPNLSVLINNGNGTFATKVDNATGSNPEDITAADFNGDGKPDLAVANNGGSSASVLINNGNGTFATKVDYPAGSGATAITAADFNGDGKPDLAVANNSSNTVSVLINNGDGTFATKADYATGTTPSGVTAADFNGDGKIDIAVVNNGSSSASVILNTTQSYGAPLASSGSIATTSVLNTPIRLRMNIGVSASGVATGGQSFKLQYATKNGSCAASTFADVTTSSPLQWYDNTNLTGGTTIGTTASDPTDGTNTRIAQTYQEANNFTNSATALYVGQDGLWDFSLIMPTGLNHALDICLRAVTSGGANLNTYSTYPEVQFGPTMNQLMRNGKHFNQSGVLQPYFLTK